MDYLDVPPEIFRIILSFSNYNTKVQLRYTSKKFYHWIDLTHFVLTYTSPLAFPQIVQKLAKIEKPISVEFKKPLFDSCKDLHPITALTNLVGIKLHDDNILGTEKDLVVLSKLTNLTSLNIRCMQINLPPHLISFLKNLKKLVFDSCDSSHTFYELFWLSKLESVKFDLPNYFERPRCPFTYIQNPEILTKLVVHGRQPGLDSLKSSLYKFTRLKYLKIRSNQYPYALDLQYFGSLEHLSLEVSAITGLQYCTRLVYLKLKEVSDPNLDFSSMCALHNIQRLVLEGGHVPSNETDAGFMTVMTALRELKISKRRLTSSKVTDNLLLNITSTDLQTLRLDYIPALLYISHLTTLRSLEIKEPSDFGVDMNQIGYYSFDNLTGLTRLHLELFSNPALNLNGMTNLREFTYIIDSESPHQTQPECPVLGIERWTDLESLHVDFMQDTLVANLSSLKKLQSLQCTMNGDCRDYSGLTQLPLTRLDLHVENSRLSFRNAIRKMTALQQLNLFHPMPHKGGKAYYTFTELVHLTELNVDGSGVRLRNFSSLTALHSICLNGCITDLDRETPYYYLKSTLTRLMHVQYYRTQMKRYKGEVLLRPEIVVDIGVDIDTNGYDLMLERTI